MSIHGQVLVIAGVGENRRVLYELARGAGYEALGVDRIPDPAEAIQPTEAIAVVLDLSDTTVGVGSLGERLDALGATRGVPIVVVTAEAAGTVRAAALRAGAADALAWPFEPEEMATRLTKAISDRRTRQDPACQPLADREAQFRAVVETSPDIVILITTDGLVEYVSRTFSGLPTGRYQGTPILRWVEPEHAARFQQTCARALSTEDTVACEVRATGAGGLSVYCRVRIRRFMPNDRRLLLFVTDITEQRLAEQARLETLAFAQETLDSLSAQIAILDTQGRIVATNRAWRACPQFFEAVGAKDATGVGFDFLTHCDTLKGPDCARLAAGIRALLAGGEAEFRIEYQCPVSEVARWFNIEVKRFPGPGLGQARLVMCRSEVSELKRGALALEESECRYRNMLERIDEVVFMGTIALDGTLESIDVIGPQIERILGRPAEDFSGDPGLLWRLVHPDDAAPLRASLSRLEESAEPTSRRYRVRHRSGDFRWIEDTLSVDRHSGGPNRIFGTARDVTVRRLAEEALERSEAELNRAQAVAQIGSWHFDRLSGAWRLSAEGHRILGTTPTGPLHLDSVLERLEPDDRVALERAWEAARSGHGFELELRLEVDGHVKSLATRGSVDLDERGQPAAISGTIQDITQRKHTEGLLLHSQKMDAIGQLTGGIAHDFNNILAVIMAFASFVRDALTEDDPRFADITEVLRAAERAVGLTRQLLTFARRQPTASQPVDLNANLEKLMNLLQRTVGAPIRLEFRPSPRPAIVRIDPIQLDQVVLNLAVNARDAMPKGGSLSMVVSHPSEDSEAYRAGRFVRVTICDTGCGMDSRIAARIFEPFFTTKSLGKGTGLGLATTYAIIQQVRGTIQVTSEVDRGTTFVIDLPVCDELISQAAEPSGSVERGRGEHVLLVEDDPSLLAASARTLSDGGYRVTTARDGHEAIHALDTMGGSFHAVVSDAVIPGPDGLEVLRHAAKVHPGVGVVLISGYLDPRFEERGTPDRRAELSDLPVLLKPFRKQALLWAVSHALEDARTPALPRTPTPPAPGERGTVLLVDDDALLAGTLKRVLTSEGFEVVAAEGVAVAKAILATERDFAAILCDLTLGDGSGTDLLAWIQQTRPEFIPRVAILTGGALDAEAEALVASGRHPVLQKPLRRDDFIRDVVALATPITPTPRSATQTTRGAESITPAPAPMFPEAAGDSGSILVVEDSPTVAATCSRILAIAGFQVTLAVSGDEAMNLLRTPEVFDAVLTDLGLPDADGLKILRCAKAADGDLPVVVMTGNPSVESAIEALSAGAATYLRKPFPRNQLVSELARAVDRRRLARVGIGMGVGIGELRDLFAEPARLRETFSAAVAGVQVRLAPIMRTSDSSLFGHEATVWSGVSPLADASHLAAVARVLGRSAELRRAAHGRLEEAIRSLGEPIGALFVRVEPSEVLESPKGLTDAPLRALASRVVLQLHCGPELRPGAMREALRLLRADGYQVSLDGIGEAQGGLAAVSEIRPDFAQFETALVRGSHRAPLQRQMVAALACLCRRAGVVTMACGLQRGEDGALLSELGFDLLCGPEGSDHP